MGWGCRVCSWLFVCLKKEKKWFSLLGQSSFLNTFGVFFSSGSAAICEWVSVCERVCATATFCWWCCHRCWHLGCIAESLQAKEEDDISLLASETHKNSRLLHPLLSHVWPWWVVCDGRNRECVTKHILSDSHGIFPWSRPRLPFMLRLSAILREWLLWIRSPAVRKKGLLHYSYTQQRNLVNSQGETY